MELKDVKTLADLKASLTAAAYETIVTEAKKEVEIDAVVTKKVEEKLSTLVDSQVTPLKTQLEQLGKQHKAYETAFVSIMGALVDGGFVETRDESAAEVAMKTQIETLVVENEKLKKGVAPKPIDPECAVKKAEEKLGDVPYKKAIMESMRMTFQTQSEFDVAFDNVASVAKRVFEQMGTPEVKAPEGKGVVAPEVTAPDPNKDARRAEMKKLVNA